MSRLHRAWLIVVIAVAAMFPAMAIASHQFTDVPTASPFHDDIGWLADAGITLGCNPPANDEFCPEASVKRQQMAAFMRRFAQYMGAEDGTPAQADNADLLDGLDSTAFVPVGGTADNANRVGGLLPGDIIRINGSMVDTPINDFQSTTWTDIVTMQIEAPVDGVLLVMGSVGAEDDASFAGNGNLRLRLTIDGVPTHNLDDGYELDLSDSAEPFASIGALNAAVAVTQGQHTVTLQAKEAGTGTYIEARSVSAIFSAFGGGIPSIPVGVPNSTNTNR